MPDLLTIALGVLFAAGTLLHTFKALENEATAHDDEDIKSGKSRRGLSTESPLPRYHSAKEAKSQSRCEIFQCDSFSSTQTAERRFFCTEKRLPHTGEPQNEPGNYLPIFSRIAAWAAARRAIGTRKGEQLT